MGFFDKKNEKNKKTATEPKADVKDAKKESMKNLYEKKQTSGKKQATQTTKDAVKKDEQKVIKNKQAYKVLIRPLITEKASSLSVDNKYFFEVAPDANKIEIAKAITEVYGVVPVNVNVIKMEGKRVRYGRTEGKKKDWKKAIVTLSKGETIKIYEGV